MNSSDLTIQTPDFAVGKCSGRGVIGVVHWLIIVGLMFMIGFLWIYFQPVNRGQTGLFWLLSISVVFKLFRLLHEWYHYWNVVPPVHRVSSRTWTVDILTTFCPGEPYDMLEQTLRAIQAIPYPHTTYLGDEANDPHVRALCQELGVRHVLRTDRNEAKAGNINNMLRQATGEICLVLDPDHVPVPDFLDQVLPYFENSNVGFVQCVQAYSNRKTSLIAYGAAEQTYHFYGPLMTAMGHYGTAQAIGANCTFRRSALDSIGGHAAGLAEDMHTAIRLHAQGWQSIYVPKPLSTGLVPATLAGYCQQQLKWARGTFELLVTTFPTVAGRLNWRQRLHYLTIPFYYLLGLVQLIDLLVPIIAMVTLRLPLRLELGVFAAAYLPLLGTAFLIRQYAQRWLTEKHEAGFHLVGGILASGTWWIYVLGLIYTIFRVEVPYLPTPKNDRLRNNLVLCLPNVTMILATLGATGFGIYHYGRFAVSNLFFQLMIGFGLLNALILSVNLIIAQEVFINGIGNWLQQLTARQSVVLTIRQLIWRGRYGFYGWLRLSTIPLFGAIILLTTGLITYTQTQRIANRPRNLQHAGSQAFYYGLTSGASTGAKAIPGWPDQLIVPRPMRWSGSSAITCPDLPDGTREIPLLYLEPAITQPHSQEAIWTFQQAVLLGKEDVHLTDFARTIRNYGKPVLMSVAPAYDDTTQNWGTNRLSTLLAYRDSWHHIVTLFKQQQVTNITWVWCPRQPATLASYQPKSADFDWIGISIIENHPEPETGVWHTFSTLYQPFHNALRLHAEFEVRQKPMLITRLATPETGQHQWLADAMAGIRERYTEIRGVVLADREALEIGLPDK